jgi:hypothetical protein
MAATFARLPCNVIWRLTPEEVPDQAAMAQLGLGNNTKVSFQCPCACASKPPSKPGAQNIQLLHAHELPACVGHELDAFLHVTDHELAAPK